MRPAPFSYLEPGTLDEACQVLADRTGTDPAAVAVLAGGQSLVAQLNARLVRPATLVGIRRLTELTAADRTGDTLHLGAAVTQRTWQQHPLAEHTPLVAAALNRVGHVPTRNRGTLGGSVAFADPTAELPTALLALDAAVRLRSASGERTVPVVEFGTGRFTTVRRPDELLVGLDVPVTTARWAFEQRHYRRHGKVSVAALAQPDGSARVALGGVGDTPLLLTVSPDAKADAVVEEAQALLTPSPDHLVSPAYRRRLLDLALTAALENLRGTATGAAA
ncbi:FAD binding domain-containing protein [Sporichthya polymorpha]|uniref:FAD binding domain-containing protein n=1 Tax=Sporichthya polymorpha TaxID=35751 RepID=UPI00037EC43D|nr:FAD binding domain-containing protein [Sporichthya polymorpha]